MVSSNSFSNIIDKYVEEIQSINAPSSERSKKYSVNTKISKILEILIGTSRTTRLGPKPLNETIDIIINNIKQKINNNLPLNIPICFGCKKTWKLCQPGIDIAELFTILQIFAGIFVFTAIFGITLLVLLKKLKALTHGAENLIED